MAWSLTWTDADAIRGRLVAPYLEELRRALIERCRVSGTSVPAIIGAPADVNSSTSSASSSSSSSGTALHPTGQVLLAGWYDAWTDTVDELIPKFVDHVESGGDYNGDATIPMWTEYSLLLALGGGARVDTQLLLADWAYQQYAFLNSMLWTQHTANITDIIGETGQSMWGATIVDAVDLSIATMPFHNTGFGGYSYVKRSDGNISGDYAGQAVRGRAKITTTVYTDEFANSVSFYGFGDEPGLTPWPITAGTWDAEATGYVQNVWNHIETTTPANTLTPTTTSRYGGTGTPPVYPPTPDDDTYGWKGWTLSQRIAVAKWNVTGGFTYQ